jgi:hypothetical protein
MADVKGCLHVYFTSVSNEVRCKRYFIFLFTSEISSTDVKPLLISHICTSAFYIDEYFDQTIETETIQQPSFISTKEVSCDVLLTPF